MTEGSKVDSNLDEGRTHRQERLRHMKLESLFGRGAFLLQLFVSGYVIPLWTET